MPRSRVMPLVLLALVACAPAGRASNCAGTSTGMIPLIDLGSGQALLV